MSAWGEFAWVFGLLANCWFGGWYCLIAGYCLIVLLCDYNYPS